MKNPKFLVFFLDDVAVEVCRYVDVRKVRDGVMHAPGIELAIYLLLLLLLQLGPQLKHLLPLARRKSIDLFGCQTHDLHDERPLLFYSRLTGRGWDGHTRLSSASGSASPRTAVHDLLHNGGINEIHHGHGLEDGKGQGGILMQQPPRLLGIIQSHGLGQMLD